MIISLNWRDVEVDFYNEKITCKIKPLDFEAYQSVLSVTAMAVSSTAENDVLRGIEQLSNKELKSICTFVFKDHLKDFKGVQIDENEKKREATVEDLTTHGIFIQLCVMLLTQLINISSITEKTKKK